MNCPPRSNMQLLPLYKPGFPYRKSTVFLVWLCLGTILIAFSFLHAAMTSRAALPELEQRARSVATLDLTDLALFTEARYTRHPSQADLHSALQEHPLALGHFPTGSLVPASASGATRP